MEFINIKNLDEVHNLLILDIFTPYKTWSSTQFVNYTFIDFFSKKMSNTIFVCLYDDRSDPYEIINFLSNYDLQYILVKSKNILKENSKFGNLFKNIRTLFLNQGNYICKLIKGLHINDIFASIPSIEAGAIGIEIYRKMHAKSLQFLWTDVLAYNGLNDVKKLPLKRYPFKYIECSLLKHSTQNYFLGKIQCSFQKKAYPKYASSFSYYYPCSYPYIDSNLYNSKLSKINKRSAIYFGSIDGGSRDISKLINVGKTKTDYYVYISGCSRFLKSRNENNLTLKILNNRIENLNDTLDIETDYFVSIVFLNSHGFSLPGKIFYYMQLNRPILIIKDGLFSNEIQKELSVFNRFCFCENDEKSISDALDAIQLSYRDDFSNNNISYYKCYENIIKYLDTNKL